MCLTHRSAAEDLQQGVQKLDETFEARLKGLKQQAAQRTTVCLNGDTYITCFIHA